MTSSTSQTKFRVGDWIEAQGLPGQPSRTGKVTELLGAPGHEHFRVRWDEQHESILYPADGVVIKRHTRRPRTKR